MQAKTGGPSGQAPKKAKSIGWPVIAVAVVIVLVIVGFIYSRIGGAGPFGGTRYAPITAADKE